MFFSTNQGSVGHRISNLMRLVIGGVMLSGLAICLGGCGSKHVPPPAIVFSIESESDTNQGQPFHCAMRSVNANQFLSESYDGVANMLFANPPNASVLASLVILPGEDQEIKIIKPDKVDIGLYCFFTEPGEPWKIRLDQPLGDEYEVVLGEDRILEAEKETGGWWPF